MTVVVVGNTIEYQNEIKSIIKEVNFKIDEDIKIKEYVNDEDIFDEINNYDCSKIYVFDVSDNNFEYCFNIAKNIRDVDWDSEIIFLVNNSENIKKIQSSIPKVFCYIEKNKLYNTIFEKALIKIINKEFNNKMFIHNTRNSKITIYYKRIKYITTDKDKRKLVLASDHGINYISLSLKDILDKLDSRFKIVHRCCIVNTDRVEKYDFKNGIIIFDNGEELNYLSKKYRSNIVS